MKVKDWTGSSWPAGQYDEKTKLIVSAYVLMFVATVANALGPALFMHIKGELNVNMSNAQLVCYFLVISGLTMIPVYVIRKMKSGNHVHPGKKANFTVWTALRLIGAIITFPLSFLAFVYAMEISGSPTGVSIIAKLSILFVVIISSLFMNDKVKSWRKVILWSAICLLGVFIMYSKSWGEDQTVSVFTVILYGLGTALLLALYRVFIKPLNQKDRLSKPLIIMLTSLVGGVTLLIILYLRGVEFSYPGHWAIVDLVILGAVTLAWSTHLMLKAYDKHSLGSLSQVEYFSPAFTFLFCLLLGVNEQFSLFYLAVGFVFVVIGTYNIQKQIKD
ncbi:MAG: hypothetical protein ABH884_00610 [Candidatus Komeilibacteria bacterium]